MIWKQLRIMPSTLEVQFLELRELQDTMDITIGKILLGPSNTLWKKSIEI